MPFHVLIAEPVLETRVSFPHSFHSIVSQANREVEDEESVQTKSWMFLFDICRVRGLLEAELAHPLWNGYRRACKDSMLEGSVLRLTVLTNFPHGAWVSGDRYFHRKEMLEAFLRNQTAEWFEDIAENIAIDRGEPVQADSVPDSFEDWLTSPSITNRGIFVARIWFRQVQCRKKYRGLSELIKAWLFFLTV